jgi:predicted ATPase
LLVFHAYINEMHGSRSKIHLTKFLTLHQQLIGSTDYVQLLKEWVAVLLSNIR